MKEGSAHIPLLEQVAHKKTPLYFDINIIDNYLFFWVNKFVEVPNCLFSLGKNNCSKLANKRTFKQEDHWDLRKEESSEGVTDKLSATFQEAKVKTNPLIRSIFATNSG